MPPRSFKRCRRGRPGYAARLGGAIIEGNVRRVRYAPGIPDAVECYLFDSLRRLMQALCTGFLLQTPGAETSRHGSASPARRGLSSASPKAKLSGGVQDSRRRVMLPLLRGRP